MNLTEKNLGRSVVKIDMVTVRKNHPEIWLGLGKPSTKGPINPKTGKPSSVYWRPQLHEIPISIKPMDDSIDAQCGIFCHLAEGDYR